MKPVVVALAKRAVVWLVALALVGTAIGVGWAANPHQPSPESVDAATESTGVTVEERPGSYVLEGDDPTRVALVFYPGGHVDPEAYVPVLAPYVENSGVRVYIPKMPLTLAVFDPDRAAAVRRQAPEIETWYVGGHSLGGAMACQYASNNPRAVDGVVLFAAYCEHPLDSATPTLQLLGSRDGVLSGAKTTDTDGNLPENATIRTITGANHSQFGSYRGQQDDLPANISYAVAHERIQQYLWAWTAVHSGSVPAPENVTLAPES